MTALAPASVMTDTVLSAVTTAPPRTPGVAGLGAVRRSVRSPIEASARLSATVTLTDPPMLSVAVETATPSVKPICVVTESASRTSEPTVIAASPRIDRTTLVIQLPAKEPPRPTWLPVAVAPAAAMAIGAENESSTSAPGAVSWKTSRTIVVVRRTMTLTAASSEMPKPKSTPRNVSSPLARSGVPADDVFDWASAQNSSWPVAAVSVTAPVPAVPAATVPTSPPVPIRPMARAPLAMYARTLEPSAGLPPAVSSARSASERGRASTLAAPAKPTPTSPPTTRVPATVTTRLSLWASRTRFRLVVIVARSSMPAMVSWPRMVRRDGAVDGDVVAGLALADHVEQRGVGVGIEAQVAGA